MQSAPEAQSSFDVQELQSAPLALPESGLPPPSEGGAGGGGVASPVGGVVGDLGGSG